MARGQQAEAAKLDAPSPPTSRSWAMAARRLAGPAEVVMGQFPPWACCNA